MFTFSPRFLLHVEAADQRASLLHLCVCTDGLFGSALKSSSLSFTRSHVTGCYIQLTFPLSETNKPVCGMTKLSRCSAPRGAPRSSFCWKRSATQLLFSHALSVPSDSSFLCLLLEECVCVCVCDCTLMLIGAQAAKEFLLLGQIDIRNR